MYNASATFNTLIKDTERMFIYSGNIETVNGDTYFFDGGDIRSGKISRSISENKLEVGTVYSSELRIELGVSIDRYELYNGVITLNIQIDGAADVIPMGYYIISEVTQTSDRISIKAYDAMTKFDDVDFDPVTYNNVLSPYEWLTTMCTACGVTLGATSSAIENLPNGNRKTGYADVVTDVKTWRDVLGYLGAYLGAYAYIGRDGKLYMGQYGSNSVDTVPSSFRYTSNLSDFRTTYDGLYAVYKEEALQEYVSNTNSGGLVLDLGTNPFLQFSDSTNRQEALQEIIDAWDGVYYVPYDSSVPMNPTYDPGDVLTFTDNQAGAYDNGAITDITYTIGGQMAVTCTGDNPRLADAQDRFTKSLEGLSSEYNNGQEIGGKSFWILLTTNDSAITVGSTKTEISQIEWAQKTSIQKVGMMFACEATLSASAKVAIEIAVDDGTIHRFSPTEEKMFKGKRIISANCGFRVTGKGNHTAYVYMTVTDSAITVGDLY